jgi:hypothetical protein
MDRAHRTSIRFDQHTMDILDKFAKEEATRTGRPVNYSGVVRKLIRTAIETNGVRPSLYEALAPLYNAGLPMDDIVGAVKTYFAQRNMENGKCMDRL